MHAWCKQQVHLTLEAGAFQWWLAGMFNSFWHMVAALYVCESILEHSEWQAELFRSEGKEKKYLAAICNHTINSVTHRKLPYELHLLLSGFTVIKLHVACPWHRQEGWHTVGKPCIQCYFLTGGKAAAQRMELVIGVQSVGNLSKSALSPLLTISKPLFYNIFQ